ncbi:uncharacterized protein EDB93DRAFT_1104900 [Suillus bovinus]|uniref:uncharacterized protein n=1 Tax=Suillus bovinus TaxID=48563 RepID=UPI001B86838A|nr:uncharacterized protein EDB93DRAFT_1104900 [Suillus bovinus]KAG2144693.1 hypothetical protein EDB93DRAFT_1104900 [Suillus bovinus]
MSTFMRTSPTQCASFIRFTVRCSMFYSFLCIFLCLSVYLLFLASRLLVVGDLGAYMRCMPLSHKTLTQHKFQKLSAIFDVGRHFYHLLSLECTALIVCVRGAFHFNPAMGFDAATISSNNDNFDLDCWRKNFKDKHANLAKKMHFM